jgi:hypothetical protein
VNEAVTRLAALERNLSAPAPLTSIDQAAVSVRQDEV